MPATVRNPSGPREKLVEVHHRLCRVYGCPIGYFHEHGPMDELVSSLLSHRTRNADSARAFRNLRERFPDWAAVRDAPVDAVREALAPCTWPEAKAPALQRILQIITARRGSLELDHLADMPVPEAREWLESLPGVGPKTSAAVLSFSSLRRRALPVDSHHHRVAQRLGLIPASLSVGPSHRVLEAMLPGEWDAQEVYDDHEVLMLHGQRVCHFRAPACGRCVLLDLCPTGQARSAPESSLRQPAFHSPA
ncbi:endonuclease III domain-containing protein [Pararoseomonas indoligenes]|uniref:Fe-S cluster assembly protein HesB n=1 Tax=Roseomonas indoligenes TaxID=2820811 RepID=A0A940MZV8_9PROT|nr:Fe-S cluster assembly protein HesB [Pararoseomonas indoligenes]MBP0492725.1 Fe-S cluster assembly protein HesB [Pararoseomonas indoligenes]